MSTKMKRFFIRIVNSLKIGYLVFIHPEPFSGNMFEMLSNLLQLIMKVSIEDKHYMTEIVVTNPQTNAKQPIVRIWAGAGINAEPLKRIKELIEENDLLKEQFKQNQRKLQENS